MGHASPGIDRALAWAGVAGGLLYVLGDMLFYGQLGAGSSFHALHAMEQRPDGVLVAGGVVAPLASAGYVLGALGLAREIRAARPRSSVVFFVGWAGMFLVGIAYHAVYTTLGFAAKLPAVEAAATLVRVRLLLSALYAGEMVFGLAGTLALVVALVSGVTRHPRWLALLTPTAWALLDGLPRALPSPIGGVLSGTWINGWFTLFFFAAACQ
jgi:Family of unknown function (DUF6796)